MERNDAALIQLARVSFYNPWADEPFLRTISGLTRKATARYLSTEAYFEEIRLPGNYNRQHGSLPRAHVQSVYAPTFKAQHSLLKASRGVGMMSSALLLQYNRLALVRKFVEGMKSKEMIHWVVSPVKISTRVAPLIIDAMVSLKAIDGAILTGIILPPRNVGLFWFIKTIQTWVEWRNYSYRSIPANLILFTPNLNSAVIRTLNLFAKFQNGGVVCFTGENMISSSDANWVDISPIGSTKPSWLDFTPVDPSLLQPDMYLSNTAKKRRSDTYNHLDTYWAWASTKNSDSARMVRFLINEGSWQMIDLLKAVTQFPHLNAPSYTSILGTKNKGSWVQSGVGLLTERGYIDRDVEGGYVPTDSGLEFLSEILGLDSYSTQRMFGWPNRNKKYVFQKDHDKLVTQFMLQLKRSGTLIAWEFSYVQKMYYVSLPPYYNKVKKITIVPDSTAILRIPGAKAVEVWVEMDRNTKRGAGFVRKIEKYFLACYGNTADQSVPPLLYIIESSNGATRRLKSVLKRFSELSEKYPNAPLIVLLTTVSAIETQPGVPIVSKKIWYVFIKGEIMDTPLSIEDTLGRISQNRTDIGKGICTL